VELLVPGGAAGQTVIGGDRRQVLLPVAGVLTARGADGRRDGPTASAASAFGQYPGFAPRQYVIVGHFPPRL
jgi:hypothetical protein